MVATTPDGTSIDYDPFTPTLMNDPYPVYRAMRAYAPLYHNAERGFWALSRYADVKAAAADWQTFTSRDSVDLDQSTKSFGEGAFVDFSPPEHTEIRGLVREAFSPKRVRMLQPVLIDQAERLMREFVERGGADIAWEYSSGLPMQIISHVIGLPPQDVPLMAERLKRFVARDAADPMSLPPDALAAAQEIRDYFSAMAVERRKAPREDLITHLATTSLPGRQLREAEVTGLCFFLFLAGVDNLSGLITNTIAALMEHPAQRAEVAAEPSLVPAAVEEAMRWDAPLQMMARTATRDVEYPYGTIPEGGRTVIIWAAANRDEREWPHAEKYDIHRPPKRQLGFGEGIHFCVGAPLARLQSTVAVRTLLKYAPEYGPAGVPERVLKTNIRTWEHLPLSF